MYRELQRYLESSPLLEGQKFNFDFVGAEPLEFAITIPTNIPEISKDALGNSKCQLLFYIASVSYFGNDTANNIENLEFFLNLKRWFESQNRKKLFPDFGPDKRVTGVYATTEGYIEATTETVGRYQINCRVEYVQLNTAPKKAPLRF